MSLAARSTAAEKMDTDCDDFADYRDCLHDLTRVNRLTLTHRPMLAWLRREAPPAASISVLDVACGHGDALRCIQRWAQRQGLAARLAGIDRNPWAIRAARDATSADVTFLTGDVFAFVPTEPFDFIVSSQFTHHLSDQEIVAFIGWMECHAKRGWLIGDLHRHWLPYHGFGILAWLARWHRFVRSDGRISIARGFVRADWRRLISQAGLPEGDVEIAWHVPFRLTVTRRCPRQ